MANLLDYDMDENIIHTVNSNYHDVTTFAQIQKARDSLSLFHTNLRGLSAHFDELQLLLTALKAQFDVIGISETREQAKVLFWRMLILMAMCFILNILTAQQVV